MKAVIYTESLQTVTLLTGGFVVFGTCMATVGGYSGMIEGSKIVIQNDSTFMLHLFRPISDSVQPWPVAITGYYAFSLWYWTMTKTLFKEL